jgi:hypothetical protein
VATGPDRSRASSGRCGAATIDQMHDRCGPGLRTLLNEVESASPVEAVEVVADELAATFGAREVSFLIADFSGRAVFRMGRAAASRTGTRFPGAEQVPLPGTSSVAGDTFDYSLDQHALQVSITDAAGHDVAAALLATVLVGSLRNERRRGADLAEQVRTANDALVENSPAGKFVTGQVLRVDLDTGAATIVNAGHPFPLRIRRGRVETIELEIDLPFGIEAGRSFRLQRFPLDAGDRIVLLTDGMIERNAERADILARLTRVDQLHPRQVVHALGDAVLHAADGNLRDDATVVCLDWYGGPPRPRVSAGGANTGTGRPPA